jgi:phosphoglycerol transferase MdoB-like AlkP superfamily enzyme
MHKVAFRAMWLMNWLWTLALLTIVVCYEQYGIVITYKALFQSNQAVDVHDSIAALMHPVYGLLAIDFLCIAIMRIGTTKRVLMQRAGRLTFAVWLGAIVWLCAQGTLYRDVLNELSKFQRMGLLAYQVVAFAEERIPHLRPYKPNEPLTPDVIRSLKGLTKTPFLPKHYAQAQGKNVIVVQLESFQQFLIPLVIDGKSVTPHLQKLAQEALVFPNIFQSISQGNTVDAEFVINTSFYPPFSEASSHKYGQKELPSLPRRLHERGYTSVTLHTNTASFWNRDALYPALGFDRYYDNTYFGNDDVIAFGPSDTVLYEKTLPILTDLRASQRPFYAHVIAQSSHHPFRLPEHHRSFALPPAWENTLVGRYVQSAHYVDEALGAFIADLKQTGLWDESIFVVYGDHFGLSPHSFDKKDQALLTWALGHPYDFRTQFNVPLLIAAPGIAPRTVTQVGGQIDIMPTLAALLGINVSEDFVFGQDLLIPSYNAVTSRFYMPKGSFIDNNTLYWSGETFEEGRARALFTPNTPVALQRAHYDAFLHLLYLLSYNDDYLESLPPRK